VPTRRGWITLILLVMLGTLVGLAEYSMQPEFCRSCHLMEPYYQAWHSSTHKNVPCSDCHFEPGWGNTIKGKLQASSQAVKFLTNTYGSKPHAEVRDSSCLRDGCHERRLLEGKVDWHIDRPGRPRVTIKFDHAPHLEQVRRGKHLRCVSCHSQIVQGQHITVTLDTCYLCHFKGFQHGRHEEALGGCTGCHEAPKDQIRISTGLFDHKEYISRGVACINCHSDSIRGQGEVPRQVCWVCHNQPDQIARYDESQFVHDNHVSKHKVECSSCHVQIQHSLEANFHKPTRLPDGGFASLANDNGACSRCHERSHMGPNLLYTGIGGRGVDDMPSPMYRAQVDCIACHKIAKQTGETALFAGQTFLAMQDTCNYCHRDKYKNTLKEWRQGVDDHLRRAQAAFDQAKARFEKVSLQGDARKQALAALDDADHNIRMVKHGHGVHNVNYATALLNYAIQRSQQVAAGPEAGP